MPLQDELIGTHPIAPNIFHKWFISTDSAVQPTLCHRALESQLPNDDAEVIQWLAEKIISHHYSEGSIKRLKRKFKELGFPKYAEQHRQIPVTDVTKKGNGTEIILIEYIESCHGNPALIKTYRLRYNPNVDQAMKGDDALLIDVVNDANGKTDLKVILGEAKFRGIPDKVVLADLSSSLGKDKLPLSYSFLVQRLYDDPTTEHVAELLDGFLIDEVKAKGNLKYAGLLLSNTKAGTYVENNFVNDNPSMVIISAGIDDPAALINNAFVKAQELLDNPPVL